MRKRVGEREISQNIFHTTQERDKDLVQGLPEDGRNG